MVFVEPFMKKHTHDMNYRKFAAITRPLLTLARKSWRFRALRSLFFLAASFFRAKCKLVYDQIRPEFYRTRLTK